MLWGHLRQETVSGHGKIQQLELCQPPPPPEKHSCGGRRLRLRGQRGRLGDRLAEKKSPSVHSCACRQPRPCPCPRPVEGPTSAAATRDTQHNPCRHRSLQGDGKDETHTTRQPAKLLAPLRTCSWDSPIPQGVMRVGCRGKAPAQGHGEVQDPPSRTQPQASSNPKQGVLFSYFKACFSGAQVMVQP